MGLGGGGGDGRVLRDGPGKIRPGPEVIKLEYSLKIKTSVYFESETVLKFYNLEARFWTRVKLRVDSTGLLTCQCLAKRMALIYHSPFRFWSPFLILSNINYMHGVVAFGWRQFETHNVAEHHEKTKVSQGTSLI